MTECLRHLISSLSVLPILSISKHSIARAENEIHEAFAKAQLPNKWLEHGNLNEYIASWCNLTKGTYIQIRGSEASGKTATICRLHHLLQDKHCYVITRFCYSFISYIISFFIAYCHLSFKIFFTI